MGRDKRSLSLAVVCALIAALLVPLTAFAQDETISVNPTSGAPGSSATVTGRGWTPNHEVQVQWGDAKGRRILVPADIAVKQDGSFSVGFKVPDDAANYSAGNPADVIVVDATVAKCTSTTQLCRGGPMTFAKFNVTQPPAQTEPISGGDLPVFNPGTPEQAIQKYVECQASLARSGGVVPGQSCWEFIAKGLGVPLRVLFPEKAEAPGKEGGWVLVPHKLPGADCHPADSGGFYCRPVQ